MTAATPTPEPEPQPSDAPTGAAPPKGSTAAPAAGIATFDLVVLDTPEPLELAQFYSALLGWRIVRVDDDWVTIRGDSGGGLAFQLAPDLKPPTWPDDTVPQQFHLDVTVADLDVAEQQVLAIGARKTGEPQEPSSFRVYLDPAGHPFCLCLDDG